MSASGDSSAPSLGGVTAEDVQRVYEQILGRTPSPPEIEHQVVNAPSLRVLLEVIFTSDEHHARVARLAASAGEPPPTPPPPPPLVNVWHEDLEPFTHRPGTWSDDGVAIVGHEGWVFLGTGTNAVLDQYQGETQLPDGWREHWAAAVATRRQEADRLGIPYAGIVVPDKLAVLGEHFPQALPASVQPPAARLASDPQLGILYPGAALREVAGGAYLRSDTHLTYGGNAALACAVLAHLGVNAGAIDTAVELTRYSTSGDLGSRFRPPIVEVVATATSFGDAVLLEDNRDEILAVGGHIGTRRVLRNERATDERVAVIFGDSYGFPAPHYQGIAWFLAQVFREVHSVWVPFGWDGEYAARVGAGAVVCQAAERFVVRPPALRVDVLALAEQTISRRRGILIEELA
jgi:hypothetical protein